MNVYDFDRTLFPGDSSIHFWRFCMKRHPSVLLVIPRATAAMINYKRGKLSWSGVMQTFFRFLRYIPDISQEVEAFWDKKLEKIHSWYLNEKKSSDDVIISAAPEFLISSAAKRLGVRYIATVMDSKTGIIDGGEECSGDVKLRRFTEEYGDAEIDEFYSDSYLDTPLAKMAVRAFMVFDGEVKPWNFENTD